MTEHQPGARHRRDRCPGVLRPWIADDGALVRLRLIGGRLPLASLVTLVEVAERFGDGTVALTRRANLQIRGIAHDDGCLAPEVVDAVEATGLLPSRSHELVRNVMVSPLSGRAGGRADLRPAAEAFDDLLCADPALADLSARFLVVLDDGRGDVAERSLDLGAVAVDADHAQLRVGEHWGDVVALTELAEVLVTLAHRFRRARDAAAVGAGTAWHVAELPDAGAGLLNVHHARDLRTQVTSLPLPRGVGAQDDGRAFCHLGVAGGLLRRADLNRIIAERATADVIVTPWRSVILPDLERHD